MQRPTSTSPHPGSTRRGSPIKFFGPSFSLAIQVSTFQILTSTAALSLCFCVFVLNTRVDPPPLPEVIAPPIVADITGDISAIYAHSGDIVHTGDVLIQLETRELQRNRRWLETRIHEAEQRIQSSVTLYEQLHQNQLDIDRSTIASDRNGVIVSVTSLRIGAGLKAGMWIAVIKKAPEALAPGAFVASFWRKFRVGRSLMPEQDRSLC
jgi:hypothetical protein